MKYNPHMLLISLKLIIILIKIVIMLYSDPSVINSEQLYNIWIYTQSSVFI